MVRFYEIIRDEDYLPKLIVTRENNDVPTLMYDTIDNSELPQYLVEYEHMGEYLAERFVVAAIAEDYHLIGFYEVSVGDFSKCYAYSKQIMIFLLLTGASKVVTFHNHPVGNVTPSETDRRSCDSLSKMFTEYDIAFLDDIVIGASSYYSIDKEQEFEYDYEP